MRLCSPKGRLPLDVGGFLPPVVLVGCKLSLKKRKPKEKKKGESTFGGKINSDGQTAHSASASAGQWEENLYVLINTNAANRAKLIPSSFPSSSTTWAGGEMGSGSVGPQRCQGSPKMALQKQQPCAPPRPSIIHATSS